MELKFNSKLVFFELKLWPFKISLGSNLTSRYFKDLWFRIKYKFHPEDLYSLDYAFCFWVLPRLKFAKENDYFSCISDEDMNKMIYAFEETIYHKDEKEINNQSWLDDNRRRGLLKNRENKIQEGRKLFAANLGRMWF